jgi:threonylcarbamoyladenosine tRNA methylthiotransferase MtaB
MSNTKKTVTLISQGCRLNHAETAGLINAFSEKGIKEVPLNESPDVVVINTCTVTENGDKDTQRLIRKINKQCNHSKIALIGCQSQIKKHELLKLKNVHWVIGNEEKKNTAQIILSNKIGVHVPTIEKKTFQQGYSSFDPRHTRVNLKIQDGCDFYCSFCIIPFARGGARSREFNEIINDASALIKLGVKELVLTGINLGTYYESGHNFYALLESLLKLSPVTRIRISSIEPTTIDKGLIALWGKYPNFCRYLHLPIQSATNEILHKMRRKYNLNEYAEYINEVKSEVPNICIGTDVIVGFPGETDHLFNKTREFLYQAPIDYFHVFSYSERTMAHSRKFDHQVDKQVIKNRSEQLRSLHNQKWLTYLNSFKHKNISVLFEQKKGDYWVGSTEHFIKVKVKSDLSLKNKLMNVYLDDVINNEMIGQIND